MPQPAQHQHVTQQQQPHSTPTTETSLERHARKCAICRHPDREAIEEQFVHWRSPEYTANYYHLGDRRVLYRHAQATGLYEQRRRNYLFTIENILECGEEIQLTASAYIKAVRAYACLCDTVRWSEPVTRVLHEYSVHTDSSAPPPVSEPIPSPQSSTDSVGVSSPLPPQTAFDNPARSAVSIAGATDHDSRATSSSEEKSSGASSVARTSDLKPPTSSISNRHIPELESPVTSTKQKADVVSNRHKFTK